MKFKPVIIEWKDACSDNNGKEFTEEQLKNIRIKDYLEQAQSIGWLIKEDKDGVMLAYTIIGPDFDFITIPRDWIKKIKLL